jgi:hypothetical protein
MSFEITELRNNSIWNLYRMRDRIQIDPEYQRQGDIWTVEKRQLFIDTILNEFDVPKLYLHRFNKAKKIKGAMREYAIIDGKQRLEAIWNFIDGKIALSDDFEYFKDAKKNAASMTYSEIGEEFPDLKVQFDSFPLAVVCIETDDIEMIEEMFSRLNEAAPLTAAEKRNSFGGPVPVAIRKLTKESFFSSSLPFPNKRYRHYDLGAKFLLAEYNQRVVDTKKIYLDTFVREFADDPNKKIGQCLSGATANVKRMASIFTQKDPLLKQVGMVMLYYQLFRYAHEEEFSTKISRKKFVEFEDIRAKNREQAEIDLAKADYDLLEFDRYTQSPNDGFAMRFRLSILLKKVFARNSKMDDL